MAKTKTLSRRQASVKQAPKVHKDLQGLDVKVNTFGEIKINLDIDRLNDFLNKNVDDKKFRNAE